MCVDKCVALSRSGLFRAGRGAFVLAVSTLAIFTLIWLAGTAQAQILIDQGRADRPPEEPPALRPDAPAPPAPSPEVEAADPGTLLRAVRVLGSSAPESELETLWRPFAGAPLDRDTILGVANAIQTAYQDSGAALFTLNAPAQDLSGGVLTLEVVEGYIEDVILEGDAEDRDMPLVRAYAARLMAERPLLRPTLERYLSLIRDIPGITADARFLEGSTHGGVYLVLTLHQRRAEFSTAFNNSGSPLLGREQLTGRATFHSLLTQGDRIMLAITAPANLESFFFASAAYRLPLGDDGVALQLRGSRLETQPKSLPIEGGATTAGVDVSWPLLRSYRRNISVFAAADLLNSTNAVFGQTFSSERTRVLRAGASWSAAGDTVQTRAGGTFSQGISGLGARTMPLAGDAGFTKLTLNAGHSRLLGEYLTLRLNAAGQYAAHALPPSERFSLGGSQFGRAFASSSMTGDHALAASAELAWRPGFIRQPFAGSEIYLFGDGARAWMRARGAFPAANADLASAGAGARALIGGKSTIGLEFARGLESPAALTDDWRVLVSWNIRN